MAWEDITPGGGYTWGGVHGGKDRYSRIDPQRRANYEASAPGKTWSWQQPKGRGNIDRKHWVQPGPSYDDRSGFAKNIPSGSNYRNIELANRGIAAVPDEGMGMIGHIKQALGMGGDDDEKTGGGFKWPSLMLIDSIANNQRHHKALDKHFKSVYGDDWRNAKNASFFKKQGFNAGTDWRDLGSNLSQQGNQAKTWFNRAGLTNQTLAKFMDPNYKFGGNEAWLRSQAENKEHFDTGMTFLKNADDSAEMFRDVRDFYTQGRAANTGELDGPVSSGVIPDDITNDIVLKQKPPEPWSDRQPGLNYFTEDQDLGAEFYEYPDEKYLGMLNRRDPSAMYEGMYESPLTDTLYGEELVDATPNRPLHSRHEFLPRDTVAIEGMGGGMNAFPEQSWADWFFGRDPSYDLTGLDEEEIDYSGYPKGRLRLYGN